MAAVAVSRVDCCGTSCTIVITREVKTAQHAADRNAGRVEAERRRLARIVACADQQHTWMMQGDLRGTFGESA